MARSNTLEIIIKASDEASSVLSGVMGRTERGLTSLGANMVKTGAVMTAAAAPFAAALVSTVQSAAQFEQSMTNVQAVLGKTDGEMQGINAQVLAMGSNSIAGPQAVANAFYDIVGGVADSSAHMAILEAAIATSEAGASDLGATTGALIAIMNSYNMSATDASMASDVLVTIVGKGVGTMDEFAAALPAVTGLANSLGISFSDLGTAMAFMTTKGFSAAEASTQLKAMMTSMVNPNAAMTQSITEMGYASGEAMVAELGLAGAFQALSAESPTFQDNMAGALGSVEALNGVIALSDEGFAEFSDSFAASAEGATDAARQIQLDSLASQTALLKSNMEGLKITIGMALIPVLTRLTRMAQPIVQSIIKWAQENPKLVSTIAAVVAGVGGLGIALTVAGGIISAVGAGLGLLFSPIMLVIGAIALLGIAFRENFLGFGDFVRGLIDDFGRLFEQIKAAFNDDGLAGIGRLLLDKIASGIQDLPGWAMDHIITPIGNALRDVDWSSVPGQIGNILQKIAEFEIDFYTWVWENIGLPIVNAIQGIDWGQVQSAAMNILAGIAAGLMDIGSWVRTNIVYPVIEWLITTDWSSVISTGLHILAKIAEAWIGIHVWVFDHVITPVANALLNADWSSILQTGWDIITKIAEAWLDLNTWIVVNLITPLGNAILAGASTVYTSALSIGTNILNGVVDGLSSLSSVVIGIINNAIPNDFGFTVDAGPLGSREINVNLPDNPVPGAARGAFARAQEPFFVGEQGMELFVPQTSGRIVPNNALERMGGRGGSGSGGNVYDMTGAQIMLPNVTNARQFFDELEREAKRRNRKLASSAVGVGG